MADNKQMAKNMFGGGVQLLIPLIVNFFLNPYMVGKLGSEAYGFIGIAGEFTSYAYLLTIAISSMASRFIMIRMYEGDKKGASIYFNSIFAANTVISAFLVVVFSVIVVFLDKMLQIPENIVFDVKVTFAIVFACMISSVLSSTYNISYSIRNRVDLQSYVNAATNIIRAVVIVVTFILIGSKLYFTVLGSLLGTLIAIIISVTVTHKWYPELKLNVKLMKFKSAWEVFLAGIWNAIQQLGQILLGQVDLIICNVFIDPATTTLMSVAKVLPNTITSLVSAFVSVFIPTFTKLYAEKKSEELIFEINRSVKILGTIVSVPIAGLIAFGLPFYTLWQPSLEGHYTSLQILSILSIGTYVVSGSINALYSVFTITNKVKTNALVLLGTGVLNTLGAIIAFIVFPSLRGNIKGSFIIVGINMTLGIIRNLVFTPLYAAHCLKVRKTAFYFSIFKTIITEIVLTSAFYLVTKLVVIDSWIKLLSTSGICAVVGYAAALLLLLDKYERKIVKRIFLKK